MSAAHSRMSAARLDNDDVTSHLLHNLPPLPSSELTDPHDDVTLPRLIEALRRRHTVRQMMLEKFSRAVGVLKSMLQQLDRQMFSTDALIQEQNEQLTEREKLIHSHQAAIERLERRTKVQEQQIDILQETIEIYEEGRRSLLQELEASELRLQRELTDKRHVEQRLNSVVTHTQLKWEKECERRTNAAVLEIQRKMWLKDETLKQLRAIVFDSETELEHQPHQKQEQESEQAAEEAPLQQKSGSSSPPPDSVLQPGLRLFPDISLHFKEPEKDSSPACHTLTPNSACELQGAPESSTECLSFHRAGMSRSDTGASRRKERMARRWSLKEDEPIVCAAHKTEGSKQRETPVRPLHQRFSSRKKILDHTPSSSLDLGTVLQPNIANAIKVRSPSEKDLCKCDRYVLTHQEVDSDGEIRTRLIKGEVLETRGGGRAILFTDTETLKQEVTRCKDSASRCSSEKNKYNYPSQILSLAHNSEYK